MSVSGGSPARVTCALGICRGFVELALTGAEHVITVPTAGDVGRRRGKTQRWWFGGSVPEGLADGRQE